MSVVSTIAVPLSGVIVDKFRIKKILFLVTIFGIGVVSLLFLFVPKVPLDVDTTELKCDAETIFTVFNENNLQITSNNTDFTIASYNNSDEIITCKVRIIYVTKNYNTYYLSWILYKYAQSKILSMALRVLLSFRKLRNLTYVTYINTFTITGFIFLSV